MTNTNSSNSIKVAIVAIIGLQLRKLRKCIASIRSTSIYTSSSSTKTTLDTFIYSINFFFSLISTCSRLMHFSHLFSPLLALEAFSLSHSLASAQRLSLFSPRTYKTQAILSSFFKLQVRQYNHCMKVQTS